MSAPRGATWRVLEGYKQGHRASWRRTAIIMGEAKPSASETAFHVHVDLSALGLESVWFCTNLSASWLKRPLRTAIVEPLLDSLSPAGGVKLRLANVRDVLIDGQPATLAQRASEFANGDAVTGGR